MKTVRQTIVLTANYYGRQISADVLEMYAEDLGDLPAEQVIAAYTHYRKDPKNKSFPLPAQIRQIVAPHEFIPAEVQAREIAARIVGAITSCGWNNGSAARLYIGPIGWQAVERQGGWSYLCENMGVNINPTTFQAQIRDQLEGSIMYGADAIENRIHSLDERRTPGLTAASDSLKQIMSKFEGPDDAS